MIGRYFFSAITCIVAALAAQSAHAANAVALANASFEILPPGGLTTPGAKPGTAYSLNTAVPGWQTTLPTPASQGGGTGQSKLGDPSNYYFNSVPDGAIVAYSNNGGILAQNNVVLISHVGARYTLSVDIGGNRNDGYIETGEAFLKIGGQFVAATGVPATTGNWSIFTASYVSTAADIGSQISILLDTPTYHGRFEQGLFDNVSLTTSVPEPASWALMLCGVGTIGAALRRRREPLTSGI